MLPAQWHHNQNVQLHFVVTRCEVVFTFITKSMASAVGGCFVVPSEEDLQDVLGKNVSE